MKNLTKILFAMAVIIAVACSKEGATGPQGPAGINGTDGVDGNANVKVYTFSSHDFSATASKNLLVPTTADTMNNSAWLVYLVRSSGNVYPIPGFGLNGTSDYRVYWLHSSPNVFFTINKVSGTGELYANIRIIRIYASGFDKGGDGSSGVTVTRTKSWNTMTEMEKAQMLYPDVDFSDFNAVSKAFGL